MARTRAETRKRWEDGHLSLIQEPHSTDEAEQYCLYLWPNIYSLDPVRNSL